MTPGSARITVSAAGSIDEARHILLQATRPNDSFTQRDLFNEARIDRALRLRLRRPEWVWFARESTDHDGEPLHGEPLHRHAADTSGPPRQPAESAVIAVVAGWGSAEVETPFVLDFLDLPVGRPDVAKAILDRAVADSTVVGRESVEIVHFLPIESRIDDPSVAGLVDLLAAAGFRLLVRRHRYRLDVRENAITIPETNLNFHSLERPDDPRLPAIMAEILVGSLDAHDRAGLARSDVVTAAAETVAEYLLLDPFKSMFLALNPDDEVVGLVIGGLRGSAETGVASFIGVSHKHRGRGYAAQLLGWITRRMIDDGALFISAETDNDNLPMAAAFARVGFAENESRIDFVREVPSSAHVNAV